MRENGQLHKNELCGFQIIKQIKNLNAQMHIYSTLNIGKERILKTDKFSLGEMFVVVTRWKSRKKKEKNKNINADCDAGKNSQRGS